MRFTTRLLATLGFIPVWMFWTVASVSAGQLFPDIPDFYSYHEMPYPCQTESDCPAWASCNAGQCWWAGAPLKLSYTDTTTVQWGGRCYEAAAHHVFQTKMAYELDSAYGGGYLWDLEQYERGIRLSHAPYYDCAPGALTWDFFVNVGAVEWCVDPWDGGDPNAEVCGYYERHRNLIIDPSTPNFPYDQCSDIQKEFQRVLVYRAGGYQVEQPSNPGTNAHMKHLAETLIDNGPFATPVKWSYTTNPQGYTECHPESNDPWHVIAIVGYDFTDPQNPVFFFQNSHASNDDIGKLKYYDWAPECGVGGEITYFTSVRSPALWDPNDAFNDPLHPFVAFQYNNDLNLNGVPDDDPAELDVDGDRLFSRWDCHPYNPWLESDLDMDGYCDAQFRPNYGESTLALCEKFCEGLDFRPEFASLGACAQLCQDWDRCMTLKIKNKSDPITPCQWACLRYDPARPDYNPNCDPTVIDTSGGPLSDYVCCEGDPNDPYSEKGRIAQCELIYGNISNSDQDEDGIADVCENEPTVTDLDFHLEDHWRLEKETEGTMLSIKCYSSMAKVSYWLFGTADWWIDDANMENHILDRGYSITTRGDIGACGCSASSWESCSIGTCPETSELTPYTFDDWAWDPIYSPDCVDIPGIDPDASLCAFKNLIYTRDEFTPAPGSPGPYHELQWFWQDHVDYSSQAPINLSTKHTKVKVGWRDFLNPYAWEQNVVTASDRSIQMPVENCSLIPKIAVDPDLIYVNAAHQPYRTTAVKNPSALGLMHASGTGDLLIMGFDTNLSGPMWVSKATYPSATEPGIQSRRYATTIARMSPANWGKEGSPEPVLFLMEVRAGAPGAQDVENVLWAGLVSKPKTPFYPAEDLFGTPETLPNPMSDPKMVFEPLRGRLLVADSGGSSAAVYSFSPKDGSWDVAAELPPGFKGFSMDLDPVSRKVIFFGGETVGAPDNLIRTLSLTSNQVQVLPVTLPPGLARGEHGSVVDYSNRKLYIYGGRSAGTLLGDLWAIDLDSWQAELISDGSDPLGPSPRAQARLVVEPRFDRLWVSGGMDDSGPADLTRWAFSPSTGQWRLDAIVSEVSPGSRSGSIAWGEIVTHELMIDNATPYPGEPTLAVLDSPEPCLGLRVADALGEELTAVEICQPSEKRVGFLAQPGERYVIEIRPLGGFDKSRRPSFELTLSEGAFSELEPWGLSRKRKPLALEVDSRPGGNVAVLLQRGKLSTYDLTDPQSPFRLASRPVGPSARDLALAGGLALITRRGRAQDLVTVDIREPTFIEFLNRVRFPGLGRFVTSWGAGAYVAGITRVNTVDLNGPDGPQFVDYFSPGGWITAIRAHGGMLLVASLGKLRLYDIHGEPELLSEAELTNVGVAIAVHGRTVHVAELGFPDWVRCQLGRRCDRKGIAEVFVIDSDRHLLETGAYDADSRSMPYLRWCGDHAFAIEHNDIVDLRVDPGVK